MDSFLRKTPSLVTLSPFFPPDFFPSKAEAETSLPQGLHFILPNPRDRVSVNNLDRNPFLGSRTRLPRVFFSSRPLQNPREKVKLHREREREKIFVRSREKLEPLIR